MSSLKHKGHLRKRKDKQREKKEFVLQYNGKPGNFKVFSEEHSEKWEEKPRYWKRFYYSKFRKKAKRETSRRLRREFRDSTHETENVPESSRKGGYRRAYDYKWEVF